ncbi:MAG: peptidoglycan-binding domain-containing protein [Candidatus Binatia bacterium]
MGAKLFGRALLVTGAIGLVGSPAWSQVGTGEPTKSQVTKEPTATPPGGEPSGSLKLSQQDIRQVHQALEKKGYKAGNSSSALDAKTKEAIRSFQKDHNLPVTGSLDDRTVRELGVDLHNSTNAKDSGAARKR